MLGSEDRFIQYPECICTEAYTGRHCQTPIPPCNESPCFPNVTCTNKRVSNSSLNDYIAQCGPCPSGLTGDGKKCYGKF